MMAKNKDTRLTYTDNLSSFGIVFPTFEQESIRAYVIEESTGLETILERDTHYTLSNIGIVGRDGTFTLINGSFAWLSAGALDPLYTLVIEHDPEAFQPGFFRNLGLNTAVTLEETLDRLTMAIKSVYRELQDAQGDLISAANDIATNAADILLNAASIAGLTTRVDELDAQILSQKQTVSNASSGTFNPTVIDETAHDGAVFEYYIKRGARRQIGKLYMINESPYQIYEVERAGNAGVSFNAVEAGSEARVQAVADASGDNAVIRYKYGKFIL
jgi:hypothetical protein